MSDEINIDCSESETAQLYLVSMRELGHVIRDLRRQNAQLTSTVAELRRELDELHARHRPKEDQ